MLFAMLAFEGHFRSDKPPPLMPAGEDVKAHLAATRDSARVPLVLARRTLRASEEPANGNPPARVTREKNIAKNMGLG